LNGLETKINLETLSALDGTSLPSMLTVPNLPLHSKTIKRTSKRESVQVAASLDAIQLGGISSATNRVYALYSLSNVTFDEIRETFDYPSQFCPNKINSGTTDPNITFESLNRFQYRIKEAGAYTFTVDASITLKSAISSYSLIWNLVIESPGGGSVFSFGSASGSGNFTSSVSATPYTVTLKEGDLVYLYCSIDVTNASIDTVQLWSGATPVSVDISADTIFPASTVKSVLIHEAVKKCVQVLTGQADCFTSNLLGRTDIGYGVDGDGSLCAITNGKLIRKTVDLAITRSGVLTASLKELLEFLNSVYCIGYGFETTNGVTRLRLERKAHFYNTNVSVDLGKVGPVTLKVDPKRYYKGIKFGFSSKLEKGAINSVDEFNTIREAVTPIGNTKNMLDISSAMHVSGYEIETQRRLIATSEDSKLDDELFAISVIRDSGSFKAKKNEGYATITNVFDPSTGYNYDFSPMRTIRNWMPWLSAMLIGAGSKVIKFTSGDTNTLMTSRKASESFTVAENGNIDCTYTTPLFDPLLYQAEDVILSRTQTQVITANPNLALKFMDRFNQPFFGFISDDGIEHDSDKGTAKITLLKTA
jgi:hypothetical protein